MVVEAGADAVGFIVDVPKSPRNLSLDKAKKLIEATPVFVETVAVTVTNDLDHLNKINMDLHPSAIQVHSTQLYERMRDRLSNVQTIGAIQVRAELAVYTVIRIADNFDAILTDSYAPDKGGGTGETHNWEFSKDVREAIYPKPLILAGGLNPENVREAIDVVKPYAVDVSSGVESSPGLKDQKKVLQFIQNVKEA